MIRVNVEEGMRFLQRLNHDIANMGELQRYIELEDMAHMKIKVERQLKRKSIFMRYGHNSSSLSF